MDVDAILLIIMFAFIAILAITAITDGFLFRYKKTPGRGYAQIAKRGMPGWLTTLHGNLELIAFLGLIVSLLAVAWRSK
jgi:hypothetical protein